MTTRLDEMAARVKKIEDQPLPLGTSSVRVAEKSEDLIIAEARQLLDRPGALEALAEAAIRKAQSNPMRAIPGFRRAKTADFCAFVIRRESSGESRIS